MKLPKRLFKNPDVCVMAQYCVFEASFLQAAKVATHLSKKHVKGLAAMGRVTVAGKKYYYCLYGFLYDPDIYSTK